MALATLSHFSDWAVLKFCYHFEQFENRINLFQIEKKLIISFKIQTFSDNTIFKKGLIGTLKTKKAILQTIVKALKCQDTSKLLFIKIKIIDTSSDQSV